MSDSTRIGELRKEIESHCGNCDRPDKEELGKIILSSMTLGFNEGLKTPSADRPQGEWIEQEDCWQCSECGDEYVLEVGVKPIDARMHYCPNCGARMKGVDDEKRWNISIRRRQEERR